MQAHEFGAGSQRPHLSLQSLAQVDARVMERSDKDHVERFAFQSQLPDHPARQISQLAAGPYGNRTRDHVALASQLEHKGGCFRPQRVAAQ